MQSGTEGRIYAPTSARESTLMRDFENSGKLDKRQLIFLSCVLCLLRYYTVFDIHIRLEIRLFKHTTISLNSQL